LTPLFVSFYTENTPYEKEATDLVASLNRFHLDYEVIAVPNLGSWSANCCHKPEFILKLLEKHNRPLVWTDVDSIIVNPPTFFNTCKADLALKIYHDLPIDAKSKINSATFFVNNTTPTRKLLGFWKDACKEALKTDPLVFDQAVLAKVLFEKMPEIKVAELPTGYLSIVDHPDDVKIAKKEQIIIHYQASRLYQKMIDGELSDVFANSLSPEELKRVRTSLSDS
jgi:hypothetical protein